MFWSYPTCKLKIEIYGVHQWGQNRWSNNSKRSKALSEHKVITHTGHTYEAFIRWHKFGFTPVCFLNNVHYVCKLISFNHNINQQAFRSSSIKGMMGSSLSTKLAKSAEYRSTDPKVPGSIRDGQGCFPQLAFIDIVVE